MRDWIRFKQCMSATWPPFSKAEVKGGARVDTVVLCGNSFGASTTETNRMPFQCGCGGTYDPNFP